MIQKNPNELFGQPNASRLSLTGNSLVVQWLGLHTSTAGGTGSIPGQRTKIPETEEKRKIIINSFLSLHLLKLFSIVH